MLCERLGEMEDDRQGNEQYHVRDEDETETESNVEKIDKNEWWRRRLKQVMYEYGYDKNFFENLVDQIRTEADGEVILSQLAVVNLCSK